MFVKEDKSFDYGKLHEVTKVVAENLDKVIDINFYPTDKTKRSNMRHRPIGIGVQGLADVFALMDIPFHSEGAKSVNTLIFETIYHAALEKSMEISRERVSYFVYSSTNFTPYTSARPGHSSGHIKVQSPFAFTRSINKSGIQRA